MCTNIVRCFEVLLFRNTDAQNIDVYSFATHMFRTLGTNPHNAQLDTTRSNRVSPKDRQSRFESDRNSPTNLGMGWSFGLRREG
jgi:hypothetical protein